MNKPREGKMTKQQAIKIIKRKVKELKPCPFCGEIPKITYSVDEKYSEYGSLGHWGKRVACCDVMSMGQNSLFFCNNNKPADYELWQWGVCNLVDQWNKRMEENV